MLVLQARLAVLVVSEPHTQTHPRRRHRHSRRGSAPRLVESQVHADGVDRDRDRVPDLDLRVAAC